MEPGYEKLIHTSATIEAELLAKAKPKRTPLDHVAVAISTCGVGYMPLAPGTWGSMVGVVIYIVFGWIDAAISGRLTAAGSTELAATAWVHSINLVLFLVFTLIGIWAAGRLTVLLGHKDPSRAVIDEVIGQLIVFLFIPYTTSWGLILAGFLIFRLLDIWKPYPIDSLQGLPAGIGVCADDILAGVYGGVCLLILYALTISL